MESNPDDTESPKEQPTTEDNSRYCDDCKGYLEIGLDACQGCCGRR